MQEYVTAGANMLRARRFYLVVADAIGAGNEDHGSGSDAAYVARIVASTGDDIHVGIARFLG